MYSRIQSYKTLFLRVSLAYVFYFFARVLFYFYNSNMIIIESVHEFFYLCFIGLTFDTSAILYANETLKKSVLYDCILLYIIFLF